MSLCVRACSKWQGRYGRGWSPVVNDTADAAFVTSIIDITAADAADVGNRVVVET